MKRSTKYGLLVVATVGFFANATENLSDTNDNHAPEEFTVVMPGHTYDQSLVLGTEVPVATLAVGQTVTAYCYKLAKTGAILIELDQRELTYSGTLGMDPNLIRDELDACK